MAKQTTKKEIRLQIQGVNGEKPNLTFKTKGQKDRFKKVAKNLIQCLRGEFEFFPQDIAWVNLQSDHTKNQLKQLGITLKHDAKEKFVLKKFLNDYLRKLDDLGDSSFRYYNATSKRLLAFFGDGYDIRNISKDDARDYVKWLVKDQKLNPNSTARRQTGYANTILQSAVEAGLLQANPFTGRDIPKNVLSDKSKIHYISSEECLRIWNVLNAEEDRLRFVLMRYLGLRSPSELNELKWSDFNWRTGMVSIRSPKLIRHERKYIRQCPFKHELALATIQAAFEKRKSDHEKILPRISHKNLTKHVKYWLAAAGLNRWPRLLNNFRSSAAIDFHDIYPIHVACAYLGHSVQVAAENYLAAHQGHAADIDKVGPRSAAQ